MPAKLKPGDTVTAWYIDAAKRRHDFKSATVVKYEREFAGWRLDVGGLQIVLPAKQIELLQAAESSGV